MMQDGNLDLEDISILKSFLVDKSLWTWLLIR